MEEKEIKINKSQKLGYYQYIPVHFSISKLYPNEIEKSRCLNLNRQYEKYKLSCVLTHLYFSVAVPIKENKVLPQFYMTVIVF